MTFKDHLLTIQQAREDLLSAIEDEFSKIPQNSDITQYSENPCCYTISASAIALSPCCILDPFYYNFTAQKNELCQIVKSTCSLESIMGKLSEIANTGRTKTSPGRYNPVVIDYVKNIVNRCSLDGLTNT